MKLIITSLTGMSFNEVYNRNSVFLCREDLLPFSFGGNKARKALLFFKDIEQNKSNYIVTYGAVTSNHCRVVANMAAQRNLPCLIISPSNTTADSFNRTITELLGARVKHCELELVHSTIEATLHELKQLGYNPYFIPGGGHGNLGTKAYVLAYEEIKAYESENDVFFDYIFLASGTGTTQAGLVCGKLLHNDVTRSIIGISIARKNPRATTVIEESVRNYLNGKGVFKQLGNSIICVDDYICGGYGSYNQDIEDCITTVLDTQGIPLDPIYTGKAFWGMTEYCRKHDVQDKNILFIHTGGTPLFFDYLSNKRKQ